LSDRLSVCLNHNPHDDPSPPLTQYLSPPKSSRRCLKSSGRWGDEGQFYSRLGALGYGRLAWWMR